VENTSGSAGESAGLIHEIKSVRQIMDVSGARSTGWRHCARAWDNRLSRGKTSPAWRLTRSAARAPS
jgi:hypothetical protein